MGQGTDRQWTQFVAVPQAEPAPPKPQKVRSFNVRVIYDPVDETYTASWGSGEDMRASALSMPTALRMLANSMDARGLHGATKDVLFDLRYAPAICCKYCNSPIFFAKLPSGKFLSFEPEPVDASIVNGVRVATFSNTVDVRNRPHVLWPSRPQGPVWIPHPEVCGNGPRPEHDVLAARYDTHRAGAVRQREHVIAGLQNILTDCGSST